MLKNAMHMRGIPKAPCAMGKARDKATEAGSGAHAFIGMHDVLHVKEA